MSVDHAWASAASKEFDRVSREGLKPANPSPRLKSHSPSGAGSDAAPKNPQTRPTKPPSVPQTRPVPRTPRPFLIHPVILRSLPHATSFSSAVKHGHSIAPPATENTYLQRGGGAVAKGSTGGGRGARGASASGRRGTSEWNGAPERAPRGSRSREARFWLCCGGT